MLAVVQDDLKQEAGAPDLSRREADALAAEGEPFRWDSPAGEARL